MNSMHTCETCGWFDDGCHHTSGKRYSTINPNDTCEHHTAFATQARRDMFAAAALEGLMTDITLSKEEVISMAVEVADALIAALDGEDAK